VWPGRHDGSNGCLVVVIPGIGGSVLESRTGDVLWNATPGAVGRLLRHPDRFASDEIARPVGLIDDWALLPGFAVLHGYEKLIESIGAAVGGSTNIDFGHPGNPKIDARVVAFPYDFRRSIVETAEELDKHIDRRLAHLGWKNQSNRIIIIAHSMGGLIARYWVAQDNWNISRAVLTLGTPHRGAPKALNYLVNGPSRWTPGGRNLRNLVRNWPSMYELAPRYQSVEDIRSQIDGPNQTLKLYPKDLDLPGLQPKLKAAFELHRHIEDAWEHNAAETHCVAYIGRGHGTLLKASWDGTRLISSKKRPTWLPMALEERGDGTVPELSACPIEQGNYLERRFLTERHSRLITAPDCISELTRLLNKMRPSNRTAREHLALMIGLDIEDSYLRGYPVDIQAWLTPRRLVPPGASLTFELTCNGKLVRKGWLDEDERDVWSIRFIHLPADTYKITVHAEPRDTFQLSNSECFFVLDELRRERDLS
jgi:triacylglycerol esterase/lipase EstA (alpha/beta hydrolase family)